MSVRYCCNSLTNEPHDMLCPRRSVVGENIDELDPSSVAFGVVGNLRQVLINLDCAIEDVEGLLRTDCDSVSVWLQIHHDLNLARSNVRCALEAAQRFTESNNEVDRNSAASKV